MRERKKNKVSRQGKEKYKKKLEAELKQLADTLTEGFDETLEIIAEDMERKAKWMNEVRDALSAEGKEEVFKNGLESAYAAILKRVSCPDTKEDIVSRTLEKALEKDISDEDGLKAELNVAIEQEFIVNTDGNAEKETAPENEKTEVADAKLQVQIDEAKDMYLRTMADFDNYRRRTSKEKSEAYSDGAIGFITALLPVLDNFERAMETETADPKFRDGVVMIYRQLTDVLEKSGVKEIDALGCEFDPQFHNAIKSVDDDEGTENVICEVFQKGYIYSNKVVRHSMVAVYS